MSKVEITKEAKRLIDLFDFVKDEKQRLVCAVTCAEQMSNACETRYIDFYKEVVYTIVVEYTNPTQN